jgi:hypothetical protein
MRPKNPVNTGVFCQKGKKHEGFCVLVGRKPVNSAPNWPCWSPTQELFLIAHLTELDLHKTIEHHQELTMIPVIIFNDHTWSSPWSQIIRAITLLFSCKGIRHDYRLASRLPLNIISNVDHQQKRASVQSRRLLRCNCSETCADSWSSTDLTSHA